MTNFVNTTTQLRDNFTDLNSLNSIKKMGRNGDEQALKEVAKQFEALFVQQLLKTMRATEDVFSEGNYDQSNEMKFHRDLMDQQMSLELTKGSGLGLAEALFNQMKAQYGSKLPSGGSAETRDPVVASTGAKQNQNSTAYANSAQVRTEQIAPIVEAQPLDVTEKISSFVDDIYDVAVEAADKLGVKVESVIAQAALETGWGQHTLADADGNSSYNFFNIKAGTRWQGDTISRVVQEFDEGLATLEQAKFRVYPSVTSAFSDFMSFLSDSPRYQHVLGQSSPKDYGTALQAAGYATDPHYADKIARIASNPVLQQALARKLL
ncbi:flagellar assembly peptidoglycan hydrolase FlgJ [Simiduia curdlanivorans]|uniref:Peptidoglycan hydrolase FlgJ n=1 Tax=Simiduia curdlanivorans TaxID=1492769 RepID=A0ABV8V1Z0_9GAMM|nr:flagellar assembly peptidoglycan hydrolase FlgJ [Simiduia curdlanivorans]MDN3639955.1 flagellar assembly peptidoglycan hydrolase FlgJ [Simiduia curdlanivorans]